MTSLSCTYIVMFFLPLVLWDVLLWTKYWVMKRNNLQEGCSKARSHAQLRFFTSCHLTADLGNVKYLSAVHAKPHDQTAQKWRLTCYWTGRKSHLWHWKWIICLLFPILASDRKQLLILALIGMSSVTRFITLYFWIFHITSILPEELRCNPDQNKPSATLQPPESM